MHFVPFPLRVLPTEGPLFRGSEGPVHEGLAPVQLSLLIELGDEGPPEVEPELLPLPVC